MTSVTTTCRDINELKPVSKLACQLLFQECYKAGIVDIFITETYRSQDRQNYLYQQGRTRKYDAKGNKLSVVTWTLNSNHTPRLAWDIAVSPPKSLYDNNTLNKVGAIAKKLGITWGGTWTSNMDKPHFEVSNNWKIPNGYKLEGTIIIPISSSVKVQLIKPTQPTLSPTIEIKGDDIVLNNTGRNEARQLIKRACQEGVFDAKSHTEAKINGYSDGDLVSYVIAYVNRKLK